MKNIFKILVFMVFVLSQFVYASDENRLSSFVKDLGADRVVVSVNKDILDDLENKSSLKIDINSFVSLEFEKKRFENHANGSVLWVGENRSKNAKVLLTYFGVMMGEVRIESDVYQISWQTDGSYTIAKEDPVKIIKGDGGIKSKEKISKPLGFEDRSISAFSIPNIGVIENSDFDLNISSDGKLQFNAMVLYTQEFANKYQQGVAARIQSLVNKANEVYRNSGLNMELNLVHYELFEDSLTDESKDIKTSLYNFQKNKKVIALKRKHKAHFATLMRRWHAKEDVCGLAFTPSINELHKIRFKDLFSVVEDMKAAERSDGQMCLETTYVHELGHNFTLKHNKAQVIEDGATSTPGYNYGYDKKDSNGKGIFATIMSYEGPEIPYFSSPNLTYTDKDGNTHIIGETGDNGADNVKAINKSKNYLANVINERLEDGEGIVEGRFMKGSIKNVMDRDAYEFIFNGEVKFKNVSGLFLNIYNADQELVLSNWGRQSAEIIHTFMQGTYYVVLADVNDDEDSVFNIFPDYYIEIEGGVIDASENPFIDNYLELKKGWNLISLPLQVSIDLNDLSSINSDILKVRTIKEKSATSFEWKYWDNDESSNTLVNLETKKGYWIKALNDTKISLGSAASVPNTISLTNNNWAMKGSNEVNPNDVLKQYNQLKIIWKYKDGKYYAFSNDTQIKNELKAAGIPTFSLIKADEGYFIK